MNRQIVNINIRFRLDNEDDRRAWGYLQTMDRKLFKSYTRAVVAAVNDYFARQKQLETDPFLETREREEAFLRRIVETVEQSLGPIIPFVTFLQGGLVLRTASPPYSVSANEPGKHEIEDAALDFIESL